MSEEPSGRKLVAILAVDIVGYSALSEESETEALTAVSRLRSALDEVALAHGGRIFNTSGDGFMLEFASAAAALNAIDRLWSGLDRASLRIGAHVGDVLVTPSGDLLGHGVNVAARLQQVAAPGDAMASIDLRRALRGKMAQRLRPAGSVQLSKMSDTLDVFTFEARDFTGNTAPSKSRAVTQLAQSPDPLRIFISHASDSATEALALAHAVEALGHRAWIAPRDVKAGVPFPRQIVAAVEDCSGFIVLLSPAANESQDVLYELHIASHARKFVAPVILRDAQPCADLRYYVGVRHQLRWSEPTTIAAAVMGGLEGST